MLVDTTVGNIVDDGGAIDDNIPPALNMSGPLAACCKCAGVATPGGGLWCGMGSPRPVE